MLLPLALIGCLIGLSSCNIYCLDGYQTKEGSFPEGSNNAMTTFPSGYTCEIHFRIESGSYIEFTASTTVDGVLVIYDAVDFVFPISGLQNVIRMPATTARVVLTTGGQSPQVLVTWKFGNANHFLQYSHEKLNTPIPINFPTFHQRIFTSSDDGFVTVQSSREDYSVYSEICVYEGDGVKGPYIGRLSSLTGQIMRNTKALTFVNFGESFGTDGYLFGTNYNSVSSYSSYHVAYDGFDGKMEENAAVTVICEISDCSIKSLQLSTNAFLRVYSLAPDLKPFTEKLTYSGTDQEKQTPQEIPAQMFTVHTSKGTASLQIGKYVENIAYPGRKGFVFSPSYWESSDLVYTSTMKLSISQASFNITRLFMEFHKNDDFLRISSGSDSLLIGYNQVYPNSIVLNGTKLDTAYSTKDTSAYFHYHFEVIGEEQPTTTTTRNSVTTSTTRNPHPSSNTTADPLPSGETTKAPHNNPSSNTTADPLITTTSATSAVFEFATVISLMIALLLTQNS